MAWYEEKEISFEDARISIKSCFNGENISYWVVEECLQNEYKKYDSFGSYRSFYTFVVPDVVKESRRKNKTARIKALQTLKRATPFIVWINSILYRPPTIQKSLRYEKVKANFEEQKK
jgi:hypothetical protein